MAYQFTSQALRGKEHRVILPVLLLALIHGSIFTFIIPPWQHYDEPTHFEFAWLIANRENTPERGEFDQSLRREVAASMLEHGFFEKMDFLPNLIAQGEPVWIGASQINQRMLYYLFVAAPLYLVRGADVVFQLFVGRMVSLVFFLITIVVSHAVVSEVTQAGNPLRWLVPVTAALIPGFADLMTSVNDDVGATVLFSLFLWAGVRAIVRGLNWSRALALVTLALACYWTKNTVTIAVILASIPLLLGMFRGRTRWVAWVILAGAGILGAMTMLSWGDAAFWYRVRYPEGAVRAVRTDTPLGKYAFHLPIEAETTPPWLTQLMTDSQVEQVRGKTVTVGAWIWASKPVKVRTPILYHDADMVYEEVEATEEPRYYQFSAAIPENPRRLQVMLFPLRSQTGESLSVYYDGLVMIEGEHSGEPSFEGSRGNQLVVEQKPVRNLLRNASAETAWPFVHVWADNFIQDFFPGRLSTILAATLDWSPPLWYYQAAARQLVTTFWARFGWGNVPLIGFHPYAILGMITAAGLIGGIFALGKRGHSVYWEVVLFLGAALAVIWGAALMRGIGSVTYGPVFIPSARYAYPAIIPTVFFLTMGWNESLIFAGRFLPLSRKMLYAVYLLFFAGLIILSFISIFNFYYR